MKLPIETTQRDDVGVLVCGHGSRSELAVKEFAELVHSLKYKITGLPVEFGYLEFAKPIIRDALNQLKEKSIQRVIAVPAMLFAAGHAKNDIPSLLNGYAAETGLQIDYGRELGINNLMLRAAGDRIKQALSLCKENNPSESLLVVVGRGSSDPDANANVSKVTRLLVESFGFGWGETVYSGVTFPLVEPGLRHAAKLGFKTIIVFPYFLFSGVLISRIHKYTEKVANDFPDIQFQSAKYLADHPLVIDTFIERINEVLVGGDTSMNCSLCKYRSEFPGFEAEVGLAQESHHQHVEGLGMNDVIHTHDHEHTRPTYPNSQHPFGPLTLQENTEIISHESLSKWDQ